MMLREGGDRITKQQTKKKKRNEKTEGEKERGGFYRTCQGE